MIAWRGDKMKENKTNLNISLVCRGSSAKSNTISSSMNNETKGSSPRYNSTTFPDFNITTCRHGIGHLNKIFLTRARQEEWWWHLVDNQHENKSKDKADTDDVRHRVLFMLMSVSRLLSTFTMMARVLFDAGYICSWRKTNALIDGYYTCRPCWEFACPLELWRTAQFPQVSPRPSRKQVEVSPHWARRRGGWSPRCSCPRASPRTSPAPLQNPPSLSQLFCFFSYTMTPTYSHQFSPLVCRFLNLYIGTPVIIHSLAALKHWMSNHSLAHDAWLIRCCIMLCIIGKGTHTVWHMLSWCVY